MDKIYYKSPIGILEIVCENNELISLKLADKLGKTSAETVFTKNIKLQLEEYFAGKKQKFDLKINPKGTEFQTRVWQELQKIPYGQTISYSELAQKLNNKNAQRAAGSACRKNPIMIIIPCHRVISKSGNLGGFAYGNKVKRFLLALENQ